MSNTWEKHTLHDVDDIHRTKSPNEHEEPVHKSDIDHPWHSWERESIKIPKEGELIVINTLRLYDDPLSKRLVKYYDMPDLSRKEWHPIKMITDIIKDIEIFHNFDSIEIPEVVWTYETFDVLWFPIDHPARSTSNTYYIDKNKILRTHMTVMWYYYFNQQSVRDRLEKQWEVWALSHGKVYRKDWADKNHFQIFHQVEWLYVCAKAKQQIGKEKLIDILSNITGSLYGKEHEIIIKEHIFPYANLSIKAKMKFGENRLDILWVSMVNGDVLDTLWVDSNKYNWLAFGAGIERLAMIKKWIPDIRILFSEEPRITKQRGNLNQKYEETSKYPSIYRDISCIIAKDIWVNNVFDTIRDEAWNLVEEVKQLDTYENEKKFGKGNVGYTYRVVYRSHERTLLNDEINGIQRKIRETLVKKWIILR